MRIHSLLLAIAVARMVLMVAACGERQTTEPVTVIHAPSVTTYVKRDPNGTTIIPNGRLLNPVGRTLVVAPHPFGLALSPDGHTAATANSSFSPDAFTIIHNIDTESPSIVEKDHPEEEEILPAAFMGLAFSLDSKKLYVSGGDKGVIAVVDAESGRLERTARLDTNFRGMEYRDSYLGDLALSNDGSKIYVVDQANFRLITVDTESLQVIDSIPVGRYPFGVALTPDGSKAFVANVGMFEYSRIPGFDPEDPGSTGIDFPAFGYGTREMIEGTVVQGKDIPGLGDPNDPRAMSVWAVDVTPAGEGRVTSRLKTGHLVGEEIEGIPAVGGASPNSVVTDGRFLYVSNGSNDTVTVIDTDSNTVLDHIAFPIDERLSHLRGVIPFGLALSSNGRRLYVALAGINAVAVVDTESQLVLGYIPTCWFPSKVCLSPDDQTLYIASAKGFGSGPNGGPSFPADRPSYIARNMFGTVSVVDISDETMLASWTETVKNNNFHFETLDANSLREQEQRNPIPPAPGLYPSPIEHVVFIAKENRTFDEVYGALEGVIGLPELARFGSERLVTNEDESLQVDKVLAMPNHLKLAREFGLSDNFYCDSDVSADGHRWLVGTYPNEWVETSTANSYSDTREFIGDSTAPGRRAMVGSSGAMYPEDYNEAGSIWEHFVRNGREFYNFGLGFEFAGSDYETSRYTGVMISINYPVPEPLMERTSRTFATYNTNVPDQFRVDNFIKEFNQKWTDGDEELPPVLTMMLPNDHGNEERPDEGYPFFESYMADNDLALGRVIEFLSHTPYWKKMVVIVTEDDAQNGVDHVDAHRSILLVISPYSKRGHVSQVHASFASIIKTIELILGIPFLNQYDAAANDLSDFLTAEPDFRPYTAVPVDTRIFDPEKALDPLDPDFNWEGFGDYPTIDDPNLMDRWAEEEDRKRELQQKERD
jgi:YVTN family beta-propeller protein